MTIELQFFEGCPHWQLAEQRIREVAGSDADVQYRLVSGPEEAAEVGFHGSPTILVDGSDPFATDETPISFACRIYTTEEGFEGAPSVAQLREVLA